MNFGERLKQLRTEKGLTQPQFAQMAGIEQSYLSKLENDKSVPSAEMFSTLLAALDMGAADFLRELDPDALATTLRHIPAVVAFTTDASATLVKDSKRWLVGSAITWILGFALVLAAHDGIFVSNKIYKYSSPGVILAGEPENIFDKYRELFALKVMSKTLTQEEALKQQGEFMMTRARPATVEWPFSRGSAYSQPEGKGYRRFELLHTEDIQAPANHVLQYLGAIVFFSGFVGLFLEWRLRRLKRTAR